MTKILSGHDSSISLTMAWYALFGVKVQTIQQILGPKSGLACIKRHDGNAHAVSMTEPCITSSLTNHTQPHSTCSLGDLQSFLELLQLVL